MCVASLWGPPRRLQPHALLRIRTSCRGTSLRVHAICRVAWSVAKHMSRRMRRRRTVVAPTSSNTTTGSVSPFTGIGPSALTSTRSSTSRRVTGVSRLRPGVASYSMHAARCIVCPVSDVAHCPQNFAWGGFAKAHGGQRLVKGVAHSRQNFIPSGLSASQRGQRMGTPSGMAVERLGYARAHVSMQATDIGVWDEATLLVNSKTREKAGVHTTGESQSHRGYASGEVSSHGVGN